MAGGGTENYTITTTTTTSGLWLDGSSGSNATQWYVINGDGGDFTIINDPIEAMREAFAKLAANFLEGREIYTNSGIIERWEQDERLAALM